MHNLFITIFLIPGRCSEHFLTVNTCVTVPVLGGGYVEHYYCLKHLQF